MGRHRIGEQLNVSLPVELAERIRLDARDRHVSIGQVVREALLSHYARARESQRPAVERDPVDAYRAGVDTTLLEKNLKLTVEHRFVQLMELQRFADELLAAGRRSRAHD